MHQNILAFSAPKARPVPPMPQELDNVVSMDSWKRRAHLRRCANGVYFVSTTLETSGDIA